MSQKPKFTVLDFETTGLNNPRATQLAMIVLDDHFQVEDEFEATFNPGQKVDDFVLELTHLTQETLDASPKFADMWPEIFPRLNNRVIIAHNAPFDMGVLANEYRAMNLDGAPRSFICTSRSARKIVAGVRNYKLPTLVEHLGINNSLAHSALGDTRATYELFLRLRQIDPDFPSSDHLKMMATQTVDGTFLSTQRPRREAVAQVDHELMSFEDACDRYEAAIDRGYVRLILTGNPRMGKPGIKKAFEGIGLNYIESPAVSDLVFIVKCDSAAGGSKINRGVALGIPIIREDTAYAIIDRYSHG